MERMLCQSPQYSYRHYHNVSSFYGQHHNNSYMWRVYVARQLFEYEASNFDYLVYTDIDVAINYKFADSIDILISSVENKTQQSCHVLFQDIGHVFNSGFFVLKNSDISISFLDEWQRSIEEGNYTNYFHQDQGYAINAALNQMSTGTNTSHNNSCIQIAIQKTRENAYICYDNWMNNILQLPPLLRARNGICLPHCNNTYPVGFATRHRNCKSFNPRANECFKGRNRSIATIIKKTCNIYDFLYH
eukprot:gene9648-20051_t